MLGCDWNQHEDGQHLAETGLNPISESLRKGALKQHKGPTGEGWDEDTSKHEL